MCPNIIEAVGPEETTEETTPETRHSQPRIIEPDMTITSKLKKFFGGSKKAQTIATEIPAQNSPGGSEPFVVTFSPEDKGYVADKTIEEIVAAIAANKNVYGKEGDVLLPLVSYAGDTFLHVVIEEEDGGLGSIISGLVSIMKFSTEIGKWHLLRVNGGGDE